ncbi:hypothetical protein K502DRAFT_323509 [Neoconidiobolus thromboides FSU 785]|nr:hypothetical protein K502DRAFT_323509 [Neoconidiobolus thromboides FSU 785]
MYSNNNKTHVLSLRIFSVFQILFWVNFGQLAYTKLGKVDEETNQPKLYESWKRGLALFLAMGLGSAISATIWFYSSKCVSRITLLKGGKSMNLEVYKFPLTTKQIKLPVEQLACSKRFTDGLAQLPTPNSEKRFYLRDLESRLSYVIDLRAKFSSPQILDHLLYKPGAFKK